MTHDEEKHLLREERAGMEDLMQSREQDVEELNDEIKALKSQLADEKSSHSMTCDSLQVILKERNDFNDEIKELKEELRQITKQLRECHVEWEKSEAEIEELKDEIEYLKARLDKIYRDKSKKICPIMSQSHVTKCRADCMMWIENYCTVLHGLQCLKWIGGSE